MWQVEQSAHAEEAGTRAELAFDEQGLLITDDPVMRAWEEEFLDDSAPDAAVTVFEHSSREPTA